MPKQFWNVGGAGTLLEDTLRRTAPLSNPGHTVVVVDRSHEVFVQRLAALGRGHRIVYQPNDRGTAAGVLFGLVEVVAAAPDSVVLLTPSDHGVGDPTSFLRGIEEAVDEVRRDPMEVVLFGATPTSPEGDYGWITPVHGSSRRRLRRVASFVEKPQADEADHLFASAAVWNTMVLVATSRRLLSLYRAHLPVLTRIFETALAAGERRTDFVRQAYQHMPVADFSRDLIGRAPDLALYTWPRAMGWSDLGTPDRLEGWRDARRVQAPRPATSVPDVTAPMVAQRTTVRVG